MEREWAKGGQGQRAASAGVRPKNNGSGLSLTGARGNQALLRLTQARQGSPRHASQISAAAEASSLVRAAHPSTTPQPLSAGIRQSAEASLGTDLGDVRVLQGPETDRSTAMLGAYAYTLGHDIVLSRGVANNAGPILAHEIAHVAQQRGSGGRKVSYGAAEAVAEHAAANILVGRPGVVPSGQGAQLQCAINPGALIQLVRPPPLASSDPERPEEPPHPEPMPDAAAFMLYRAAAGDCEGAAARLRETGALERRGVALSFILRTSDAQLQRYYDMAAGVALLVDCYEEIVTGALMFPDQTKARMRLEQLFLENADLTGYVAGKPLKTFPYKKHGFTRTDPAVPDASPGQQGNINVAYSPQEYGSNTTLRDQASLSAWISTSHGASLPAAELIRIRNFDLPGHPVVMGTGLELIGLTQDALRSSAQKGVEIASLPAVLHSILAFGAVELGSWAEASALMNVWGQGVFVLGVVLNEHRDEVAASPAGRRLLDDVDSLNSLFALYGLGLLAKGSAASLIERLGGPGAMEALKQRLKAEFREALSGDELRAETRKALLRAQAEIEGLLERLDGGSGPPGMAPAVTDGPPARTQALVVHAAEEKAKLSNLLFSKRKKPLPGPRWGVVASETTYGHTFWMDKHNAKISKEVLVKRAQEDGNQISKWTDNQKAAELIGQIVEQHRTQGTLTPGQVIYEPLQDPSLGFSVLGDGTEVQCDMLVIVMEDAGGQHWVKTAYPYSSAHPH